MRLEDEIPVELAETELLVRRRHLYAVAEALAERVRWLDNWLPEAQASSLPPNDWPEQVSAERNAITAARAELLTRRMNQLQAEDAALLLWQTQLDTITDLVQERERAHVQTAPQPRAALNRPVAAPELSPAPHLPAHAPAEDWRTTMALPQAKLSKDTVDLAPLPASNEPAATRASKRRTGRIAPRIEPADDPRDLTSPPTPRDLPTLGPQPSAPPTRPRVRSVTEPFAAALDLDGLYLQRSEIKLDIEQGTLFVRISESARHAERVDVPSQPQQLRYRSREGDLGVFAVRGGKFVMDGGQPVLALDVRHWSAAELVEFVRALDALP